MWCNYSRVAFPEVKEWEQKASWACPVFKINCVKQGTGGKEQTGLWPFSPPLDCLQCHQSTSYNLSSPMTSVQLQGAAASLPPLAAPSRALQQLRIKGMQQLRSPSSHPCFKILLFQKGKPWFVLVVPHPSASLLKFTITKVMGKTLEMSVQSKQLAP